MAMQIREYIARPLGVRAFQFDRREALKTIKDDMKDVEGFLVCLGVDVKWYFDLNDSGHNGYSDSNIWFSTILPDGSTVILSDGDYLIIGDEKLTSVMGWKEFKNVYN